MSSRGGFVSSAISWMASPKGLVLLLLVVQNSAHTLLTAYTQKTLQQKYVPSTVIVLSEIVKTLYSYLMIDKRDLDHAKLINTSLPMAVPAFLYFINNWLIFQALKSLSPAVYATLAQMKLLTTAVFAVIMLGKQLSVGQWRALFLLTMGSILVQSNPCVTDSPAGNTNLMSGTFAMIIYAVLSGFSGIYFEKVLKGTKLSLWERNVQLGAFSILVGLISLFNSSDQLRENGFFGGYTWLTFFVVLTSAAGGLLVALVVKYGDNIVKGFATAFAIVLTSVIGYVFMGGDMSLNFMVGAGNVIMSIFIYSDSEPVRRIHSGSIAALEYEEKQGHDVEAGSSLMRRDSSADRIAKNPSPVNKVSSKF